MKNTKANAAISGRASIAALNAVNITKMNSRGRRKIISNLQNSIQNR